jgi:hypothetical protein
MSKVVLNGLLNGVSGKLGGLVFEQTAAGTRLRQSVTPRDPQTDAQLASRERLRQAQAAYQTLTDAEVAQWRLYADTLNAQNLRGGRRTLLRANNVYCGLACKVLQMFPDGVIPPVPPALPFLGDGIEVSAAAVGDTVTFTASGANAAEVSTELLLQRLETRFRAAQPDKYRTQGFAAFTADSRTWAVAPPRGWYAAAYRFVRTTTGQESAVIALPGVWQV